MILFIVKGKRSIGIFTVITVEVQAKTYERKKKN
jgi:hypothetical protein